ncbi:Bifunctional oligoribonuclease and PAP phosphatase NrnA [compost metagenome]
MQNQNIQAAIDKINSEETRSVAIVMHNKPDGDSIGSAVALEEMLIALGKKVDLIIHNKINKSFAPIIGEHRVERIVSPSMGKLYDLLIMVDFSDISRTIRGVERMAKFTIVIDHHTQNSPYGDIYICENYSSTGIIIFKIIEQIMPISVSMANALYMTIVADTNNFKNSNTGHVSHEIASKLMFIGVDINCINRIFEDKSLEFMNLMGLTLCEIKFDRKYKITYLVVTRDDILASKVKGEEVVQLIDEIRWIKDGDITLLFIEGIRNVRISARSKFTPVNKILEKFGGGGHPKAAGCAIEDADLYRTVDSVLAYTRKQIDKISQHKK